MPRRVFSGPSSTPAKSPIKIPLNDDRQEKASRLHSRQAQHEMHMIQIKAAATPLRKRRSLLAQSPHTPANDDNDMPSVSGTAVTPMKRVPILANFEEWMKMATDNKINAANSWNFALIDYFHDMSLLKEGDGVNFQRASCTLDGCVKIYTNRVDSVATETGKLLSGLADSNRDKRKDEEAGHVDEDDDGEEGQDGVRKKAKKRTQRTAETTLASSFSHLQLKKMELEFSIDPLFKKASADFDEGGAKGLLLNHLAIDATGRIVFDSSDDVQDVQGGQAADGDGEEESGIAAVQPDSGPNPTALADVDIDSLGAKFFADLAILDEQDICPSLKTFELGEADGSLDLPFMKNAADWRQESQEEAQAETVVEDLNNDNIGGYEDDENLLGALDIADGAGFGEGGELWAREAALEPQLRVHAMQSVESDDQDMADGEGMDKDEYTLSMRLGQGQQQQNILDYFDKALQKNWAGPEHWKIRRVKDAAKAASSGPTKRKEREAFEIDFGCPMGQSLADALYTPAAANSAISLPRTQWRSKTRNLLPDDKHFSSRQLLQLFLKPKTALGGRRWAGHKPLNSVQTAGEVDEEYWARQGKQEGLDSDEDGRVGNYDANFFQDDGFAGAGGDEDEADEFADARDHFSPHADEAGGQAGAAATANGPFGAQLVTQSRRLRPEYVQYARVAKKVDVRRLKEEIWRGLAFDESESTSVPSKQAADEALRFTEVINNLQTVYPKQAMADISTSYCFICVLHLANEKGLVINNHADFQELTIQKDHTAEIAGFAG